MAETKKTTEPAVKKTSTTKKPTSTSKKTVTKKKPSTTIKVKPLPKEDVKPKTTKKPTTKKVEAKPASTKKRKPKILASESIVKKQAISKTLEKKDVPVKKRGKTFYLIFSIVVFIGVFFYINNTVYDNTSYIESAVFAFMVLFVIFVLLNFNIHMLFINFFRLPIKYLLEEAKLEIQKEVIVDQKKSGFSRKFGKYRAIFALIFYTLILMLLVGSQVYAGILDGDKVTIIITQSSMTGLVFIIIVCSWQYLFNIIPNILEKSIDAKNGFILTLSALAMVIYVIFIVFGITYLAETMIFILIIGFIALLGVNLNMIVGEINIFSNLRDRKNKTVARIVFMIFFGFHLYIIMYASVIAFSIYNWNPDAYNFINTPYNDEISENVEYLDPSDSTWKPVDKVYDNLGNEIKAVYNKFGEEITQFIDTNGNVINELYTEDGEPLMDMYIMVDDGINPPYTSMLHNVSDGDTTFFFGEFAYHDGTVVGFNRQEVKHSYGDFLYYTVVTVSTLGYGDITPNTNYTMAKSWGAFLGIYGVTFYALSIGFVSNIAIEGAQRKED